MRSLILSVVTIVGMSSIARAESFAVCRFQATTEDYIISKNYNELIFVAYASSLETEADATGTLRPRHIGDRSPMDLRRLPIEAATGMITEYDRLSLAEYDQGSYGKESSSGFLGHGANPKVDSEIKRTFKLWTNSKQEVSFEPLKLIGGRMSPVRQVLRSLGSLRLPIHPSYGVEGGYSVNVSFILTCENREGGTQLMATLYPNFWGPYNIRFPDDVHPSPRTGHKNKVWPPIPNTPTPSLP